MAVRGVHPVVVVLMLRQIVHIVFWSVAFAVVFLCVFGLIVGPPVYLVVRIKRKLT